MYLSREIRARNRPGSESRIARKSRSKKTDGRSVVFAPRDVEVEATGGILLTRLHRKVLQLRDTFNANCEGKPTKKELFEFLDSELNMSRLFIQDVLWQAEQIQREYSIDIY